MQRLAQGVNRALWSVHRKLIPATLKGKRNATAALGGAVAVAPMAVLGFVLTLAIGNKAKEKV